MLDIEFAYYLKNQAELVKKYNGKYIVIKGEDIIGVFDSETDAYFKTSQTHEIGTFLIQLCNEGNSAYTQTYHSRVTFS